MPPGKYEALGLLALYAKEIATGDEGRVLKREDDGDPPPRLKRDTRPYYRKFEKRR